MGSFVIDSGYNLDWWPDLEQLTGNNARQLKNVEPGGNTYFRLTEVNSLKYVNREHKW